MMIGEQEVMELGSDAEPPVRCLPIALCIVHKSRATCAKFTP